MKEIIKTYKIDDLETVIPMDRDDFYKEQIEVYKKTGKPTMACEIVDIFIFNLSQEMLVQKRSYQKRHNPGLMDKSIGGHVQYGDGVDYTVMVETVQELQTPSIVLKSKEDYNKTRKLLDDYLTTIAIIKHAKSKLYIMEKVFDGEKIKIANKVNVYFGIYAGNIRPADREAQGILFYTLPELENEIKKFPETFSGDMHVFLKELSGDMKEFLKSRVKK